jgi:hypothetical protein
MANQKVDNQKISGGVIATAGTNTNVWYQRDAFNKFSLNGSFASLQTIFDWVTVKSADQRLFKAGVAKFCGNRKTLVVDFDSPFPSTDYFFLFSGNNNVNLYSIDKKKIKAVIKGSFNLESEISWLAIHKELAILTGVNNPGTIFAGQRQMLGVDSQQLDGEGNIKSGLDMEDDDDANNDRWYNGEMIIKPDQELDGFVENMNLNDYSVILTSNNNINMFWIEKAIDRVKIGTSFETPCVIDYLIIKAGVNWWNEL